MLFSQEASFLRFFHQYTRDKIVVFGKRFEDFKDIIVAILIAKRGKYSQSFLNTSFFFIISSAIIGGPVIARNNPFINTISANKRSQNVAVEYNPQRDNISTVISIKPRDKIINYTVQSRDTLSSIANRFRISVDTIKWENNIKGVTIKPGKILKIPPVTGIVHKVKSGESIYSIAKKYHTTAQNIINFPFNEFANEDTFALKLGQILYVPNGVIIKKKAPSLHYARGTNPLFASVQAGVKGTSNFIWPTTGVITQYATWYHMAIDIANPSAPPILASDTGTVIYSGCIRYGYGCHIIIDHANGYKTLYAHLSKIYVSPGQRVNKRTQIGRMGSTGRSTGTHLHFEIRYNNHRLNPLRFLK